MKKLILFTAVFYFTTKIIYAQPGRFDPAFGNQGIVKTDLGSAYNYADLGKQVLLKKDGSIYLVTEVAGTTLVTKKLANGSTDVSYGNNGWSVAVGIHGAHAALQPDGKIVVAGYVFDSEGNSNES